MSRLAAPAVVVDAPLGADEIAEMKQHLDFLRTYKEALRLRLNAAEDLLVNGRREPSDRGVCRHLLGKVDRSVVEAAAGREPFRSDAAARARLLAGALRLTADTGVLLDYLETLALLRSHGEAARAFGEIVGRIDFAGLSATRLARVLQVLTQTFDGHERVQVLFSLLAEPAFRRAFDAAASALPPEVAAHFTPLGAVHRHLLDAETRTRAADEDPAVLAVGLEQVLSAPDPVLRGYPEPLRVRLVELTLRPGLPAELSDRASGVLLASLPRTGRTFAQLGIARASQLLARHADDRARGVLEEIHRAQPGAHTAERWLAALDGRRIGRVSVHGAEADGTRLTAGFWLDGQRAVWVRTATLESAARLRDEARLQMALALPGVATLVEHGTDAGLAYVAVAGAGEPLGTADAPALDMGGALARAATIARILHAVALAGVVLPDAEPGRFLHASRAPQSLTLADLDGAVAAEPSAASAAHGRVAAATAVRLVPPGPLAAMPPEVREPLLRMLEQDAPSLPALVAVLDRALLAARTRV